MLKEVNECKPHGIMANKKYILSSSLNKCEVLEKHYCFGNDKSKRINPLETLALHALSRVQYWTFLFVKYLNETYIENLVFPRLSLSLPHVPVPNNVERPHARVHLQHGDHVLTPGDELLVPKRESQDGGDGVDLELGFQYFVFSYDPSTRGTVATATTATCCTRHRIADNALRPLRESDTQPVFWSCPWTRKISLFVLHANAGCPGVI